MRCSLPHASALCAEGGCAIARCDPGFGDCDGDAANGCEASLLDDASACGECGAACSFAHAEASCVDGRCQLQACEPGYADCAPDSQGCESKLSDATSCGRCELRCEYPNAKSRCVLPEVGEPSCALERCDAGFRDCDGRPDNGCERDVRAVPGSDTDPCLPEANCIGNGFGDRMFYFCSASRTWAEARSACQRQIGGDLAVLRDADTLMFLQSRVQTRVWIGHNDQTVPDLWIWASTNIPFWRGTANGRALQGAYVRWARGEPNRSGDCGALTASA
jgi:hypothetical protein